MKFLVFVGLLALSVLAVGAEPSSRAKRFAGFGAISTVGGRVGCVVSENGPSNYSLYINSHFTKFLSADEQAELDDYKAELARFKADIKAFLEERQKQALAHRGAFGGVGAPSPRGAPPVEQDAAIGGGAVGPVGSVGGAKQPEPPKKPSFCSEKAVTQYVFDGCSVQGDNVFIGDNFVRKLTPAEQDELAQFDKQFNAYQKAVTSNFRQQVEEIFGKHFGGLFEAGGSSKSAEAAAGGASPRGGALAADASEGGAKTSEAPALEAPKTPNFCTLIV